MGLLDALAGPLLGPLTGVTDQGHEDLVTEVGQLLEKEGGIDGLVGLFEAKGLGDVVASWIANGPNLPISPEQLEAVLGRAPMQAIAQKLGIDEQEAASHLAMLLPQVVDRLTPEGRVPEFGSLGGLLGTLE